MPKGDKSSDNGQNADFGHRKVRDFMRKDFQLEESIRFNRAKADKNQEIRIQGLRSDFQRYHQQIESVIKYIIETLPAKAKKSFSDAMQEYEKLKGGFSDVIRFTTSDQPAIKPSDYFTLRLPDLERSARNAKEARLNDAVNQIRPFHQKLVNQVLLAKVREGTKRTDQLRQAIAKNRDSEGKIARLQALLQRETTKSKDLKDKAAKLQDQLQRAIAKNRSFRQESEKQRSTILEMAMNMNQDMEALSKKYREYSQLNSQKEYLFPQDAEATFNKIQEDIDAYNSIFKDNARNFHQTKVSDLFKVYATLSDKYQAISAGVKQLEKDIERKNFEEEQRQILERAKPGLTSKADQAFAHLERLHSECLHSEHLHLSTDILETRNTDYIETFKTLLGYLSPETLEDFEKCGVEFVVRQIRSDAKVFYPQVAKGENNTLRIELPIPYKYGIHGLALRTLDLLLEIHQQRDDRVPNPEKRAEIATRVFLANERLGKHKFPREGYEMAEMYYRDYETGICQAFTNGSITKDTSKDELIKIGHKYAHLKYLESIKPPEGIPGLFPTMQPGSYFEESKIYELNEGQRPVEVGTPAFNNLMRMLMERKQKGDNYTLTVNIMLDKKILVQPFYTMDGLRSHHPINAGGKHTVWAGEIDIDYDPETRTGTVLRIKDQSGHFRTFDPSDPSRMINYALEEFQEKGFNTTQTDIQLTALVGHEEVSYSNYRPLSLTGLNEGQTTMEDFYQLGLEAMLPQDMPFTRWPALKTGSLPGSRSVSPGFRKQKQLNHRERSSTFSILRSKPALD